MNDLLNSSGDERTPGGAILMDGNRLRDEIVAALAQTIVAAGTPPVCLATVLVGDDAVAASWIQRLFPVTYWRWVARGMSRSFRDT